MQIEVTEVALPSTSALLLPQTEGICFFFHQSCILKLYKKDASLIQLPSILPRLLGK